MLMLLVRVASIYPYILLAQLPGSECGRNKFIAIRRIQSRNDHYLLCMFIIIICVFAYVCLH